MVELRPLAQEAAAHICTLEPIQHVTWTSDFRKQHERICKFIFSSNKHHYKHYLAPPLTRGFALFSRTCHIGWPTRREMEGTSLADLRGTPTEVGMR